MIAARAAPRDPYEEIVRTLEREMADRRIPGASIAIGVRAGPLGPREGRGDRADALEGSGRRSRRATPA